MSGDCTVLGRWINQNGSELVIDHSDAGQFSGWFQSAKGRAARDRQYPVLGLQNGEIISFMVEFADSRENLHAVSSFSGRLAHNRDGIEEIHTIWVLARQFEDEERAKPTQPWNAFLVNSDVFRRIADGG